MKKISLLLLLSLIISAPFALAQEDWTDSSSETETTTEYESSDSNQVADCASTDSCADTSSEDSSALGSDSTSDDSDLEVEY